MTMTPFERQLDRIERALLIACGQDHTVEDPAERVKAIAAAVGSWDEALHPRGKDGKFIEKLGFVKGAFNWVTDSDGKANPLSKGTSKDVPRAKTIGFSSGNGASTNDPWIMVTYDGPDPELKGKVGFARASEVSEAAATKARIDATPDTPVMTDEENADLQALRNRVHQLDTQSASEATDAQSGGDFDAPRESDPEGALQALRDRVHAPTDDFGRSDEENIEPTESAGLPSPDQPGPELNAAKEAFSEVFHQNADNYSPEAVEQKLRSSMRSDQDRERFQKAYDEALVQMQAADDAGFRVGGTATGTVKATDPSNGRIEYIDVEGAEIIAIETANFGESEPRVWVKGAVDYRGLKRNAWASLSDLEPGQSNDGGDGDGTPTAVPNPRAAAEPAFAPRAGDLDSAERALDYYSSMSPSMMGTTERVGDRVSTPLGDGEITESHKTGPDSYVVMMELDDGQFTAAEIGRDGSIEMLPGYFFDDDPEGASDPDSVLPEDSIADTADADDVVIETVEDFMDKWGDKGIDSWLAENEDRILLSKVVAEAQGEGTGTQFMNDLTDYADRSGKRIELTPSSDFGGSKSRLIEFYKRFGFVENKGRNKDYEVSETMYRLPTDERR